MGFFKRSAPEPAPTETRGQREQRDAREAIVKDLTKNIHDRNRAAQVRALPGGEEMVAEAVRRSANWCS
jgi:hypothetical protein